jgi:hypothetical protein
VLGAVAHADERHVGHRLGGGGRDLRDLEAARDDVVAHRGDQSGGRLEAFLSLVGDEDAKRIGRLRHERELALARPILVAVGLGQVVV